MINIVKPTLLLDSKKMMSNIEFMATKAKVNNLIFRPHFKTHQSVEIGKIFLDYEIDKITVSSLDMALYFIKGGWKDITIAFPFNIKQIDILNKIKENITINILVESFETVEFLKKYLKRKVNVFIKIDAGYGRTGIKSSNIELINFLIEIIKSSKKMSFKGFLSHAGNSYKAKSLEEIKKIHFDQIKVMNNLRNVFNNNDVIYSIGDTPTCSTMNDFFGISEIRPGNFIFYDAMQFNISACSFEKIAVCLATPIVAKHNSRNQIVVYGGAIHLSKEYIKINATQIYGLPVKINKDGWSEPLANSYVKSLSQEHGIIQLSENEFNQFSIGDIIGIIPIHSCLTANLMKKYLTLDKREITTL